MAGPRALFQRRQAFSAPVGLFHPRDIEVPECGVRSDPQRRIASMSTDDCTPKVTQADELRLPRLLSSKSQRALCREAEVKVSGSPRRSMLGSSPVVGTPAASFGCCAARGFDRALMDDTGAHAGIATEWIIDRLAVAGSYVGRQTHSALVQAQPHAERLTSQAFNSVSSAMSTAVTSAGEYIATLTQPEKERWLDPHIKVPDISDASLDFGVLQKQEQDDGDAWAQVHDQLHRLDAQVRVHEKTVEEQVRGIEHRWKLEQEEKDCKKRLDFHETEYVPFRELRQLPQIAEPQEPGAPQQRWTPRVSGHHQVRPQEERALQTSYSSQPQSHQQSVPIEASYLANTTPPLSCSLDTNRAAWQSSLSTPASSCASNHSMKSSLALASHLQPSRVLSIASQCVTAHAVPSLSPPRFDPSTKSSVATVSPLQTSRSQASNEPPAPPRLINPSARR